MLSTGDSIFGPQDRPQGRNRAYVPRSGQVRARITPRRKAVHSTSGALRQMATPRPVGTIRRKDARVTLHILAEARAGGRHLVGWLLDLSTRGLFLRTDTPLAAGSQASLEFCLPEGTDVIRCIGEAISSVQPGALGPGGNRFNFVVMRPAHRRRLDAFISQRLATRRLPARFSGDVEISLLKDSMFLDDIGALPSDDAEAIAVDRLPDVGCFLEEVRGDDGFEPWNDVGQVSPDDMFEVS